jgi:hypothetical protein
MRIKNKKYIRCIRIVKMKKEKKKKGRSISKTKKKTKSYLVALLGSVLPEDDSVGVETCRRLG